ncbi:periplasmic divalent cation tolerance protein [Limnobacter thiooxidans]|jgi:periplasmic divalent cation tolerance protein|uniref:Divalent-cation tolerance protein CutA n=1 Tax=Limnobacter thiooxidans TaxID=131080 RepID=A0AA86J3X8_9BURK|nr:divalent-cation tolerance protein CutA [Limnobacter sp.]MCZ8015078.1 divalent-cation tolerance protein CutA [Limnobacter sp.]RZS40266.1 periplasmic divalent cation tolerance protein [Limnobacter thiooxidans]BET27301.1 divalent-cation tolerance protein CutA [Limnobacter thiooxidans]
MNTNCFVAYTTVDSKTKATNLARQLVESGGIACASIVGPIESVYFWQGQLEQTPEWMLMMKCSEKQVEKLKAVIVELHEYDLPELIVLPIVDGHLPYLNWIASTQGSAS